MARNGHLELPLVMGVAAVGALSGDFLFFTIGKIRGAAFIDKRPRWQQRVSRLNPLLQRFRYPLILGFRFWYGMRAVVPLVFGMSRFRTGPFVILNALGALLWAVVLGGLGYWLGNVAGVFVENAHRATGWLLAAGIICLVAGRLAANGVFPIGKTRRRE
jgi:membrane protein DedA with SNARE-associated domain